MRKPLRYVVAASLAVGGLSFMRTPSAPADTTGVETKNTANADKLVLPQGIAAKDLKEDDAVRKAFGNFEAAAVKLNGFGNVVESLVPFDRDRIKQFQQNQNDPLNDVVTKIATQWKAKYNQDFNMTDDVRAKAFSGVQISAGQIDDPGQLAGHWPVPQGMGVEAQTASAKEGAMPPAKETWLEKGADVAIARVPGMFGLPEVRASLVKKSMGGWYFSLPANITGQMVHDNLVKQLSLVADHPDQWPSDVSAAYGLVGHHAIMALYNVDTK